MVFDGDVPGWVVFETQEEAGDENERVVAGFDREDWSSGTPGG